MISKKKFQKKSKRSGTVGQAGVCGVLFTAIYGLLSRYKAPVAGWNGQTISNVCPTTTQKKWDTSGTSGPEAGQQALWQLNNFFIRYWFTKKNQINRKKVWPLWPLWPPEGNYPLSAANYRDTRPLGAIRTDRQYSKPGHTCTSELWPEYGQ